MHSALTQTSHSEFVNTKVRSIDMSKVTSLAALTVTSNDDLESLDVSALVDGLSLGFTIGSNAELRSIDVSALESVGAL